MHIYLPYDHSSALVWVLGSLWVNFKGRNRSRRLPTFVSIAFRDDACVGFLIRQTLFFPFSSFMGASRIPQTFNVIRFICDAMPFNIRLVGNREEKKSDIVWIMIEIFCVGFHSLACFIRFFFFVLFKRKIGCIKLQKACVGGSARCFIMIKIPFYELHTLVHWSISWPMLGPAAATLE